MKVILKQDVKGIGRKYEIKEVKEGYANNFLIPRKLAEFATKESIKKAEILRSAMQAEIEIKEKLTESQINLLKDLKIIIKKKANEKGHLFEQIHIDDILSALKEQGGIEIDPKFLVIEKPIKEIGEHTILVETQKSKATLALLVEAN